MRIQRVRTDAGWHGRIVADNGEPVWTTEVLADPREVDNAGRLLLELVDEIRATPDVRHLEDVDERTHAPD